MEFDLNHTIALLARTPLVLDVFLRELPQMWTSQNEGENSWAVFDVVGHLIHGERTDWIPRTRIILERGEDRPFDRFDRFAQAEENQNKSLPELLSQFSQLRRGNLQILRSLHLTSKDLARRGKHPELGVVTLSQLLATWAAHDLTHLHQISRIMAHQYRKAVGPWTKYLGVMQCAGHSS